MLSVGTDPDEAGGRLGEVSWQGRLPLVMKREKKGTS